jgi:hypothetical protein
MNINWVPLFGDFTFNPDGSVVFNGREITYVDDKQVSHPDGAAVGLALCDSHFLSGTISVKVVTEQVGTKFNASICLSANPASNSQLIAGLGSFHGAMFSVTAFDGKRWVLFENASSGDLGNISPDREYILSVSVFGQRVVLKVNGVPVVDTVLPVALNGRPIGLYTMSKGKVTFSDFHVSPQKPKAFVVMQFSAPYNELYDSVIKPVCLDQKIDVIRVDEKYGPGLIISDIIQQINEASVVIAEITPSNPNVYYEVGYAHAKGKPTILIAEEGIKLPFDVSPFRVLMYKNTIEGKSKVEAALRAHLQAIFTAGSGAAFTSA